nr:MAG TPA: hypothetical protein [Caudoviricetes sp.]
MEHFEGLEIYQCKGYISFLYNSLTDYLADLIH